MNNLWIIIATIIALIPVLLIKQYIVTKNFNYLILALIAYIVLIICYINIFNTNVVSSTYVILQILQILIMVIIGIILYKENINITKIIVIILGILAIVLLYK